MECFGCHKLGHYKRECPEKRNKEAGKEIGAVNVTCANAFHAQSVNAFNTSRVGLEWYEVQLDCQADISIIDDRLLTDISPANVSV